MWNYVIFSIMKFFLRMNECHVDLNIHLNICISTSTSHHSVTLYMGMLNTPFSSHNIPHSTSSYKGECQNPQQFSLLFIHVLPGDIPRFFTGMYMCIHAWLTYISPQLITVIVLGLYYKNESNSGWMVDYILALNPRNNRATCRPL